MLQNMPGKKGKTWATPMFAKRARQRVYAERVKEASDRTVRLRRSGESAVGGTRDQDLRRRSISNMELTIVSESKATIAKARRTTTKG
jgi:hypothetical protein